MSLPRIAALAVVTAFAAISLVALIQHLISIETAPISGGIVAGIAAGVVAPAVVSRKKHRDTHG